MTSNEIRRSFLEFFAANGHRIVPSSPLVPADDPTLLFTNAGMNQFKDVFLGKEHREYRRATSSQKCMRVSGKHNDLENVGPSLRHHTFFEMLGNFSFGDYFKKDAIEFAWRLLTEVWHLPPERLHATVFQGEAGIPRDDDAYGYWRRFVPADRISELGLADNFWQMGDTGPCGRCSEIHYFRGNDLPCPEPVCLGVACSCDRYVEMWNNVFMEFDRHSDGILVPLPAPSIDTGMGLERIAAILQGKLSNYDTDLFVPLLDAIGDLAGGVRHEGSMSPQDVSMRVIADHGRAMTFLIADGVVPSNEWRGYVLRKIMRRAMRHGHRLGLKDPFLHRLVDVLVEEMGPAYPELPNGRDYVVQVVLSEEQRFESVLSGGLPRLEDLLDQEAASGGTSLPGDEVFRLYDSFGLPVDFIEDVAGQRGLSIDHAGFQEAMASQRERGRAKSGFGGARAEGLVVDADVQRELREAGDIFEGYERTTVPGIPIIVLLDEEGHRVERLGEDQSGYAALPRTPFYIESGGQVSDTGRLTAADGAAAVVEGLVRVAGGTARLHRIRVTRGTLSHRAIVTAQVDDTVRDRTRRNHTATHLLHAALRQVLGGHVKQAGSLVAPDRLRFDFVHFAPLTPAQVVEVEAIVNREVMKNTPVTTELRSTEEAIAAGAMALFGEKYGDHVRVVSVPGFSMELCGGTHCRTTGDIGFFAISEESGIAAGVRRIEALTGDGAVTLFQDQRTALHAVLSTLNAPQDQAVEAVERLHAEVRKLAREVGQLKMKAAIGGAGQADEDVVEIGPARVLTRRVPDLDKNGLRTLADSLKARLKTGVVVLGSAGEDKASIVVSVTPDLTDRVHAGKIVKQIAPIIGGGGGGRADFAEAGGKQPAKLDELFAESRRVVQQMLGVGR